MLLISAGLITLHDFLVAGAEGVGVPSPCLTLTLAARIFSGWYSHPPLLPLPASPPHTLSLSPLPILPTLPHPALFSLPPSSASLESQGCLLTHGDTHVASHSAGRWVVAGVQGLDDRPSAQLPFRLCSDSPALHGSASWREAPCIVLTPNHLPICRGTPVPGSEILARWVLRPSPGDPGPWGRGWAHLHFIVTLLTPTVSSTGPGTEA